jgi:GT2 family glycosyltransferase
MHIQVRETLPDLPSEVGSGGLFVVFWCDQIPVGQLSIPMLLLPLTSAQLAELVPPVIAGAIGNRIFGNVVEAVSMRPRERVRSDTPTLQHLLELNRPLEKCARLEPLTGRDQSAAPALSISVVICTKNRPEALRRCLASMRHLLSAPFEIIVVDNDPSSGMTPIVTEAFPEVRLVAQPQSGLSAARNAGIRNSTGAIVAFTDDDVTVHPAWLGATQRVLDDPRVSATTGLVLPSELATAAQYAFQTASLGWDLGYAALDFDSTFFRNTMPEGSPVWRIGAGANMAFRREVFERVGYFDERLGAGAAGCSEDSELWYRLLAEGHQCRYDPAAVVFHSHRRDWDEISEQAYSYMRGHVTALLFQFDRYRHWGNLYRAFWALPLHFMNLSVLSLQRRIAEFCVAFTGQSIEPPLVEQVRGMFAGYAYYLNHRHRPANAWNPDAACRYTADSSSGRV